MDPETRLSDGETQPLNDESSPHFVDEGKEPLSTGPSRQAPDIALSFAEKPALGLGVEGLGTDVIRASNSSDTESRYSKNSRLIHRGPTDGSHSLVRKSGS